jgi:hypothetical protein
MRRDRATQHDDRGEIEGPPRRARRWCMRVSGRGHRHLLLRLVPPLPPPPPPLCRGTTTTCSALRRPWRMMTCSPLSPASRHLLLAMMTTCLVRLGFSSPTVSRSTARRWPTTALTSCRTGNRSQSQTSSPPCCTGSLGRGGHGHGCGRGEPREAQPALTSWPLCRHRRCLGPLLWQHCPLRRIGVRRHPLRQGQDPA